MAKHPAVGGAKWHSQFSDDQLSIYQDGNDDIFFKVVIHGKRPKYFYNETAWSDVSRYCADELGPAYWGVLS